MTSVLKPSPETGILYAEEKDFPLLKQIFIGSFDPSRELARIPKAKQESFMRYPMEKLQSYFHDNDCDIVKAVSLRDPSVTQGYLASRRYYNYWQIEQLYTLPGDERPGRRLMEHYMKTAEMAGIAYVSLKPQRIIELDAPVYTTDGFYERFGFGGRGETTMYKFFY